MLIDCYGHSISTTSVIVLCMNVVVNIYNLMIIWLSDASAVELLLGHDYETKRNTIIIQTIVSIYAIIFSSIEKTSCLIFSIKFWTFGAILISMCLDVMMAFTAAINLLFGEALNEFWKNRTNERETTAPEYVYLLVATISIAYFVFKTYSAFTIINFGKKLGSDLFGDTYFTEDQDIERNTAGGQNDSLASLPSYEQCVTEPPPPPYDLVSKY